jgi:hypothetical protein
MSVVPERAQGLVVFAAGRPNGRFDRMTATSPGC